MTRQRRDFSDRVLAEIDKDRRTAAQKARDAKVTSDAHTATVIGLAAIPANDIARHCEGVLQAVRDALCAHLDPEGAASTFGRFAHIATTQGPQRRAAAEHAYSRLTAANDGAAHD